MSFFQQMSGLLSQYSGGNAPANPEQATEHFEQVARQAPQANLAGALEQVFRSNETGTFGQNISQLFAQSNGQQRAGILNQLLPHAGGLGSLGGMFGQMGGAAPQMSQITPEMAQQVPPQAVEQMANQAQQQNPSVVQEASQFYSQHPTLVKALGAGAAILALRHFAAQ